MRSHMEIHSTKETRYCSTEFQPKAIIPLCDWEQVQMDVRVPRCLTFEYQACSNQTPMYTSMIMTHL